MTSAHPQTAIGAFMVHKAEADALLAQLAEMSANHFDVAPDAVNWGHVGVLVESVALLRRALGGE